MHYRGQDIFGLVHYVDKVWYPSVHEHRFAPWCLAGREKTAVPLIQTILTPAKPRNQPVTCLFCLHLRAGARSGKPV